MPEIRAVLFDVFGTLLNTKGVLPAVVATLPEFFALLGIPEAEWESAAPVTRAARFRTTAEFQRMPFFLHRDLMIAGNLQAASDLGRAISRADAEALGARQFARVVAGSSLRDGAAELLGSLRARGLHLGAVSNSDEDQLAMMLGVEGLGSLLDAHLCSETARSCKPDAAIFRTALEQAGCSAAEAVFIGDTPSDDIAGARAVGMRTVLILDDTPMMFRGATTIDGDSGGADHVIRELPELLELLQ